MDGIRFEIPSRFRHFKSVRVRYACWDLGYVHLIDPRSETVLARLYPLDRTRNADGLRRSLEPIANSSAGNVTTLTYEPTFGQVSSIRDALNSVTTFNYDSHGNPTSVSDPLNNVTTATTNVILFT